MMYYHQCYSIYEAGPIMWHLCQSQLYKSASESCSRTIKVDISYNSSCYSQVVTFKENPLFLKHRFSHQNYRGLPSNMIAVSFNSITFIQFAEALG